MQAESGNSRDEMRARLKARLRAKKQSRTGTSLPQEGTTTEATSEQDMKGKQQDALLAYAGNDPEKLKMVQMVLKNPTLLEEMMRSANEMAEDEDEDEEAPPNV